MDEIALRVACHRDAVGLLAWADLLEDAGRAAEAAAFRDLCEQDRGFSDGNGYGYGNGYGDGDGYPGSTS